jgi:hypothetical protein
LSATGGNQEKALALYKYNLELSLALWKPLALLEVAFRNSMHRELSKAQIYGLENWHHSVELQTLLQSPDGRNTLKTAIMKLERKLGSATSDGVVSELSFGDWVRMLDRKYMHSLWVPILQHAFTPGTKWQDLYPNIKKCRDIRNRIAHHEPIWDSDVHQDLQAITFCMQHVSPAIIEWADAIAPIMDTLRTKPLLNG